MTFGVDDILPVLMFSAHNLLYFWCALMAVLLLYLSVRFKLQQKYFYIVRHGETLLNKEHIKQGQEGSLSEKGKMQALQVGKALVDHHIQKIYTSPYERALETAHLMQESLGCPIQTLDLLRERKNASEVLGKKTDDPEVIQISGLTAYGYHEDTYRYSDEENFVDLFERARDCARFLSRIPENKVVVVTHHAFLQMFLSYLLYRDTLHAEDYVKLSFYNPAENAGITLCVYHPWHGIYSKTKGWEIITYSQPLEFTRAIVTDPTSEKAPVRADS